MNYEILDHPADVLVRVYGDTFEELLVNSSKAMMDVLTDRTKVRPEKKIDIRVSGNSPEELLIRWLEEIHYIHEVEAMLFADFEVSIYDETSITGVGVGENIDFSRHDLYIDIKAVTFHKLSVTYVNNKFVVEILFDI